MPELVPLAAHFERMLSARRRLSLRETPQGPDRGAPPLKLGLEALSCLRYTGQVDRTLPVTLAVRFTRAGRLRWST
ncbi:MAG: hypothetical protein QM767_07075 [Anaeromyxobacter sp.]